MYHEKNTIVHRRIVMALNCYCTVRMSYQKYQAMAQLLRMAMKRELLSIQRYLKHRTPSEAFRKEFDNAFSKVKINCYFIGNIWPFDAIRLNDFKWTTFFINSSRTYSRRVNKCWAVIKWLERVIKFNFQNCQTECEARLYLAYCNCVLYYMPRFEDDITICGPFATECVSRVTRELQIKTNASFLCECLPGCFAVNYNTEISLSPLLPRSTWLLDNGLTAPDTAIVHIYYKENTVRSQRKEQLIGFTEFLCKFNFEIDSIEFRIQRSFSVCSQHRRSFGPFYGIQCDINHWTDLFYDHSTILQLLTNFRESSSNIWWRFSKGPKFTPQKKVRRSFNGTRKETRTQSSLSIYRLDFCQFNEFLIWYISCSTCCLLCDQIHS